MVLRDFINVVCVRKFFDFLVMFIIMREVNIVMNLNLFVIFVVNVFFEVQSLKDILNIFIYLFIILSLNMKGYVSVVNVSRVLF